MYFTEAETGAAIAASGVDRSDVWVTAKSASRQTRLTPVSESSSEHGPAPLTIDTRTTAEDVRRSVAESIARLGSIPDLLLIHNPFVPEARRIGEFWMHLEALVKDGTLAGCSLGISTFRAPGHRGGHESRDHPARELPGGRGAMWAPCCLNGRSRAARSL